MPIKSVEPPRPIETSRSQILYRVNPGYRHRMLPSRPDRMPATSSGPTTT